MKILDGKTLAAEIKEELRVKTQKLVNGGHRAPHLVAVLVGDDGASQTYVNNKIKSCQRIGFQSTFIHKDADISEAALLEIVHKLNTDDSVDGFIVQLPLPAHIDDEKVTLAINPDKDVDGFHPVNVGKMALGLPSFVSATPLGIITILKRYNIKTSGMHCVVIGRSNIVGRPISILMSRNAEPGNCTVTVCHSRTKDLKAEARRADILIVAVGKAEYINGDYVKEGAIVIDVGIQRVPDETAKKGYVIKGDVDFDDVAPKASYITPVPGGVGAMTVTGLLMNTFDAAQKHLSR